MSVEISEVTLGSFSKESGSNGSNASKKGRSGRIRLDVDDIGDVVVVLVVVEDVVVNATASRRTWGICEEVASASKKSRPEKAEEPRALEKNHSTVLKRRKMRVT